MQPWILYPRNMENILLVIVLHVHINSCGTVLYSTVTVLLLCRGNCAVTVPLKKWTGMSSSNVEIKCNVTSGRLWFVCNKLQTHAYFAAIPYILWLLAWSMQSFKSDTMSNHDVGQSSGGFLGLVFMSA